MNKKLLEMNKEALNDKEKEALNKQQIVEGIRKSKYDINDQLALVINLLAENIDSLKESKHKDEFVKFLNTRSQVKKEIKGE